MQNCTPARIAPAESKVSHETSLSQNDSDQPNGALATGNTTSA